MNRSQPARITRRTFLRGATLGAAAVSIQPILATRPLYAAAPGIPGRFLVVINLLGGNDGLNSVVPTHLGAYVDRRPNLNLVENLPAGTALHDLTGGWKLHYSLQNLKGIWDAGDLHVVQKVSYPNPNQSHFTSQDIYSFGVRDYAKDGDGRGWLGRFADTYCASPVEPLGVVSVGVGRRRDFESDVTAPLVLNNVAGFTVDTDTEPGQDGALRLKVVQENLAADTPPLIDPGKVIFETNKQAYELVRRVQAETAGWIDPGTYVGNTAIMRNLKTIAQLLHARDSFGTKVFYTGFGGFDTHSAQHATAGNGRQEQLMEQLDAALGVFSEDMKTRGLWNDCVVVVISEFGRRNFENGSLGTDHGHGNSFLVAGGRVKGRFEAGSGLTGDVTESDIADNATMPFGFDFRDVYGDIVTSHLGLDPAPLFPDPGYTPSPNDIDVV